MERNYTIPSDTVVIRTIETFGVPHVVSVQILMQIKVWIESMGPEAAVKRLKGLKQLYVNTIAGGTQSETWISRHADGKPKGPFKYLWRDLDNHKVRTKILNVLMVYSGIKLKKVSKNQWKKFQGSFERKVEWTYPRFYNRIMDITTRYSARFQKVWYNSSYDDPRVWCNSPSKRTVVFKPYEGLVKGIENEYPLDYHLMVNDVYGEGTPSRLFPRLYQQSGYRPDEGPQIEFISDELINLNPPIVGSIAVIQERGCKARFIANPYRVHQIALSRLGNSLIKFLRQLSWDCTHDQDKGMEFCAHKLRAGFRSHCVDLSDATNNFPVVLQVELLRVLSNDPEYQESLDLFLWLNQNGFWTRPTEVSHLHKKDLLRCTQGQALGLYPSFASFAFSHGMVIRALEVKHGVGNTFAILGDDVVIFHEGVYKDYILTLSELHIPVSHDKCIISDNLAEFAGKIITKSGPLKVEKWKGVTLADPLAFLRWIGLRGASLIPVGIRDKILKIAELPEPLGLGFNPLGKSASDRLDAVNYEYFLENSLLRDDKELEHKQREYELRLALVEASSDADRRLLIESPPNRQEWRLSNDDHIMIDHINGVIKALGYLPYSLKEAYDKLQAKQKLSLASRLQQSTKNLLKVLYNKMFGKPKFYK